MEWGKVFDPTGLAQNLFATAVWGVLGVVALLVSRNAKKQVGKVKKLEQGIREMSEGWEKILSAGVTSDIRTVIYFRNENAITVFRMHVDKLRFASVLTIGGCFSVIAILLSLPAVTFEWLRVLFGLLLLWWVGLFWYYVFVLQLASKALETLTQKSSDGYNTWLRALLSDLHAGLAAKRVSPSDLSADLTAKLLAQEKPDSAKPS